MLPKARPELAKIRKVADLAVAGLHMEAAILAAVAAKADAALKLVASEAAALLEAAA